MRKIKATYIGQDGSLGYKSGVEYSLFATQEINNHGEVTIERVSGGGKCLYSSLYAFLRSWTLIKTDNALD